MQVRLTVVSGPHHGREFVFEGRDTFLVGRSKECHFQLSYDDPYFSRRQFLLDVNPPRCRLIDLGSRNGTRLNGTRVQTAEVADGDEIGVGHSWFKVNIVAPPADEPQTLLLFDPQPRDGPTEDYGAAVPGYRIDRELGRGGMGVVYRATSERDGQAVALKTITPAKGTNPRALERFLRECRILAELSHENIVGCREVGEAEGLVFLAMELVEGPTLGEWLQGQGPGDVRTAVRIVCQVLGGLAHAHAKGFVHRDIKPGNVLIGRRGPKRVAKLADFGLARVYEVSKLSGLTLPGEVGGTPLYMAPEQATHYRQVRPAADQYSAAATLYKLLTGRHTHDFPDDIGGRLAHLITAPVVPIAQRRPDVPAELAAVLHRALSREPEDRYPDVSAFRKELKRFA